MDYVLMSKNTPVLKMNISDNVITEIKDIYNIVYLPYGIGMNDKTLMFDLQNWLFSRSIPASRTNLYEGMELLNSSGSDDTSFLIERCLGLSLSDQYWINPVASPKQWKNINFFENPFSEDVGKVLFDNIKIVNANLFSPDNTSDGVIPKKWKIINGERCLIKGCTVTAEQEPFNEKVASMICEAMNVSKYVTYELVIDNGRPISICKNAIDSNSEYVSAYSLLKNTVYDNNTSRYDHYANICKSLGISEDEIETHLDEMIVLDYIICNTDRHTRNFGLIRNVETLEFTGVMPIFDNGTSMRSGYITEKIFSENEYSFKSKCFRTTHHEQIKQIKHPERFEVDKLYSLSDSIGEIYSMGDVLSPVRVRYLKEFFTQRVASLDKSLCSLMPKRNYSFRQDKGNTSGIEKVIQTANKMSDVINNDTLGLNKDSKGQER